MRERSLLSWALLLGIPVLLLASRELPLLPDGRVHAHFLDVGQGDSALLVSPSGAQILIDGGPNLSSLEEISKRMPFFDRRIEMVVLSHPNADHLTALPEFVRRYGVDHVLGTLVAYDIARYSDFLAALREEHSLVLLPPLGEVLEIGDGLVFDILWPPPSLHGVKNINDSSIILRARFGTESVLFTGDIERRVEESLLTSGSDLRADILKVAHHGSRTSSTEKFLRAVSPALAVISVGKRNSYGHPHGNILNRFANLGIPVRRTDREGTISLTLDGSPGIE